MLNIAIPAGTSFELEHLVLDYNGTLACGGVLKNGVMQRLERLNAQLTIHVITADTFGSAHDACRADFLNLHIIGKTNQDIAKRRYVETLGSASCIAVGNGCNDALMLDAAALGIAVMQEEGLFTKTLLASDLCFPSINDLLDALLDPSRLIATMRN